jgi:CIC family chloride channel protein
MDHETKVNNTAPNDASEAAVLAEIEEHHETLLLRRRVFPRAGLVGAIAGLTALAFRAILRGADVSRTALISWAHTLPAAGWVFPVMLGLVGAGIAVALTTRWACAAAGSGIPNVEAVLDGHGKLAWRRLLPVKFLGGIIGIGSGLTMGREGPTIQMGAAVGEAIAESMHVSGQERLTLITAGSGAGLAAAFNAPLAGLVFVLEEIRHDFEPIVFGACLVAAIVADIVARVGAGQFPVFDVPTYPVPPLGSLPAFVVLGVVAGLFGAAFNKSLLAMMDLYSRVPKHLTVAAAAATGAAIGLVGWFSPILIGSGNSLAGSVLQGNMLFSTILVFFVMRFLMTIASYGTGASGGIFAPLLVLGALIGLAIGQLAHLVTPTLVPIPAAFAVVGMAAYFVAVVRAPLTGIVLITEMTGTYSYMLPLLVSCFCAYAVCELLRDKPIYEALLERELQRR